MGFKGSYDRVAAFARQWREGKTESVNLRANEQLVHTRTSSGFIERGDSQALCIENGTSSRDRYQTSLKSRQRCYQFRELQQVVGTGLLVKVIERQIRCNERFVLDFNSTFIQIKKKPGVRLFATFRTLATSDFLDVARGSVFDYISSEHVPTSRPPCTRCSFARRIAPLGSIFGQPQHQPAGLG